MGAAELLRELSDAGFALIAVDGKLLVTPASRLTDRLRDELRACKPQLIDLLTLQTHHSHPAEGCRCNDCRHLLPRGTCARPIEAGLIPAAEGYGLAWPPEGHGFSCPAFEGQQAPPSGTWPPAWCVTAARAGANYPSALRGLHHGPRPRLRKI